MLLVQLPVRGDLFSPQNDFLYKKEHGERYRRLLIDIEHLNLGTAPLPQLYGWKHSTSNISTLLKTGSYSSTTISVLGQSLNLLSSILIILLTSDTLLCYYNEHFLAVYEFGGERTEYAKLVHLD